MKKLIRNDILKVEPYKAGKTIESLKRELEIEGEIIKLASNENPLGPSPLALAAMKNSLEEVHLYPDNNCHVLTEKLAGHVGVAYENLKIGKGITELFFPICIAFLHPGENVVMSKPSFNRIKQVTNILGNDLIEVPLKDYRHDLDAILESINGETKIVYLDNPTNPIGTMVNSREIAGFIERLPEDVLVLFDEAYHEYAHGKEYPNTLKYVQEGRNVIVLRTFSKAYGLAGIRVGYSIANEHLIDALLRTSSPFSVNHLGQVGAYAALDDLEHLERTRRLNEAGKKFLYQSFEEMSVSYIPTETNFITVDVKTDALEIYKLLQGLGVIVRPLTPYDEPSLLRITIGTAEENEKFVQALKKVLQK